MRTVDEAGRAAECLRATPPLPRLSGSQPPPFLLMSSELPLPRLDDLLLVRRVHGRYSCVVRTDRADERSLWGLTGRKVERLFTGTRWEKDVQIVRSRLVYSKVVFVL